MVDKGGPFKAICRRAGLIHSIGQTWRSTGEHSNLGQTNVLILEAVEEGLECRAAKVCDRAKTSEQTASRYLLELSLADILQKGTLNHYSVAQTYCNQLTSMVVRRSNLLNN